MTKSHYHTSVVHYSVSLKDVQTHTHRKDSYNIMIVWTTLTVIIISISTMIDAHHVTNVVKQIHALTQSFFWTYTSNMINISTSQVVRERVGTLYICTTQNGTVCVCYCVFLLLVLSMQPPKCVYCWWCALFLMHYTSISIIDSAFTHTIATPSRYMLPTNDESEQRSCFLHARSVFQWSLDLIRFVVDWSSTTYNIHPIFNNSVPRRSRKQIRSL